MDIQFLSGDEKDAEYFEDCLESYNYEIRRFEQEALYKQFIVKATIDGVTIGGGIGYSSLYKIGYIDTIWVEKNFRHQSIGSKILSELERQLREYGCELCHLETFDFQAPDFYIKHDYEVFGTLSLEKENITEYYLKKNL